MLWPILRGVRVSPPFKASTYPCVGNFDETWAFSIFFGVPIVLTVMYMYMYSVCVFNVDVVVAVNYMYIYIYIQYACSVWLLMCVTGAVRCALYSACIGSGRGTVQ